MANARVHFPLWAIIAVPVCLIGLANGFKKNDPKPTSKPRAQPTETHSVSQETILLSQKASRVLERLVKTHPSSKVNTDLNGMIERREILLNFQDMLMEDSWSLATVTYLRSASHGLTLTLVIRASGLLDEETSDEFKQMVIYHEYIHIEQAKDGRVPKEQFMPHATEEGISADEMRTMYISEVEAYEEECKLAISLHWEGNFLLCQTYKSAGKAAMKRSLAEQYAAVPLYHPHAALLISLAAAP